VCLRVDDEEGLLQLQQAARNAGAHSQSGPPASARPRPGTGAFARVSCTRSPVVGTHSFATSHFAPEPLVLSCLHMHGRMRKQQATDV